MDFCNICQLVEPLVSWFLIEVVLVVGAWHIGPVSIANVATPMAPGMTNTMALGRVLYTQYLYLFQAAGLILLTAMIGAIV